jgi:choline dehydrogenase-like flavoprotein
MLPSWFLPILNWDSGLSFKLRALKFRHMNGFISIARDRDTGRVYRDTASGRPRIQYTPSRFDRAHVLEGVVALARIAFVTGAEEIHVCISGTEPFIRHPEPPHSSPAMDESSEALQARFATWLSALQNTSNAPPAGIFASAHQMGTNRMATHPSQGVVDPQGAVWGTRGLYVADASVFPSASGVNPMVTNMAICDWISRGIGRELNGGRERVSGGAKL